MTPLRAALPLLPHSLPLADTRPSPLAAPPRPSRPCCRFSPSLLTPTPLAHRCIHPLSPPRCSRAVQNKQLSRRFDLRRSFASLRFARGRDLLEFATRAVAVASLLIPGCCCCPRDAPVCAAVGVVAVLFVVFSLEVSLRGGIAEIHARDRLAGGHCWKATVLCASRAVSSHIQLPPSFHSHAGQRPHRTAQREHDAERSGPRVDACSSIITRDRKSPSPLPTCWKSLAVIDRVLPPRCTALRCVTA